MLKKHTLTLYGETEHDCRQEKTPELKKKPEKKTIWTTEENNKHQTLYGCDILVENGSLEDVSIKNAPTDSYIIKYEHEEKTYYDLTRGTKITLFDMYWDKFKNGLKSIEYGKGGIKPNLWGYKAPQQKKKRKG